MIWEITYHDFLSLSFAAASGSVSCGDLCAARTAAVTGTVARGAVPDRGCSGPDAGGGLGDQDREVNDEAE